MTLRDEIQIFKLEEDLYDLLISAAGDKCADNLEDNIDYIGQAVIAYHAGIDKELEFLKELGWTEEQVKAQLFDEELSLEEEMKLQKD